MLRTKKMGNIYYLKPVKKGECPMHSSLCSGRFHACGQCLKEFIVHGQKPNMTCSPKCYKLRSRAWCKKNEEYHKKNFKFTKERYQSAILDFFARKRS